MKERKKVAKLKVEPSSNLDFKDLNSNPTEYYVTFLRVP